MPRNVNLDVPNIVDDQPFNPYTELQILRHNAEIIRFVTKIDDNRFASAGTDCVVLIWDVHLGLQLHTLRGHSRPVTNMFLLKSSKPASVDDTNKQPAGVEESVASMDNNSSALLLTGASDRLVCIWNIDTGLCLHMLTELESPVRCLLVMEEVGGFCAGGERLCLWNNDGVCLCKYNTKEAEDIQQMVAMQELLIAVVDKQLENCFASGSLDGTIILWAVPSLNPTRYLNSIDEYEGCDKMYPYSIQHMFCLEQRYIFAAIGAGFSVYDSTTGKLIAKRSQAHYSKILHINFVYNGAFLATCSEDGSVRLWNTDSSGSPTCKESDKVQIRTPTMEKFTKKSKEELEKLGYQNEVIKPKLIGECQAHSGAVQMCVDFGGEGFVSCAADGTLILWKDSIRQSQIRNMKIMKMVMNSSQNVSGII